MKLAKTLAFAVVMAMWAVDASALADLEAVDEDMQVKATAFTDMRLDKAEFKDIEASYLVHSARDIHHGTPGITLRFSNHAANERRFRVSAAVNQSAAVNRNFSIRPGGTVEFTLFMPLAVERYDGYSTDHILSIAEMTDGAAVRVPKGMDVPIGGFEDGSKEDPWLLLSARISPKKLKESLSNAMHARKYEQKYKEYVRANHYLGTSAGHTGKLSGKKGGAAGAGTLEKATPFRFKANQFRFPAANWPGDWRCYSTYDGVFITADEYATLGADVKSALETYRALGGTLVVAKGQDGFADQKEAADLPRMIDRSVAVLVGDLDLRSYYYGKSESTEDLKRIPIEAKASVPVNALLAVLAVFALGIVPTMILISVRRNARMKLLAWLPGSAAVFAVIVAISAFVFFGTTPSVRLQSVTVLDQTTKKALTRGQFAVFSPVSVDGRVEFPSDAAFARRNFRSDGRSDSIKVESTDVQRLTSGWVKPLVTTFLDFTRVCERSERLDFRVSPTGGVTVVNLLGAKVAWGYANVGGRLWCFRDVEPGAEVPAQSVENPRLYPAGERYPFTSKETDFGRNWTKTVEFAKEKSFARTPAGEYVAEVEGSPFFQSPLARKANTSAAGIVFGKFKEVAE